MTLELPLWFILVLFCTGVGFLLGVMGLIGAFGIVVFARVAGKNQEEKNSEQTIDGY